MEETTLLVRCSQAPWRMGGIKNKTNKNLIKSQLFINLELLWGTSCPPTVEAVFPPALKEPMY